MDTTININQVLKKGNELRELFPLCLKEDTQQEIYSFSNRKKRKLVRQVLNLFQQSNQEWDELADKFVEILNAIKNRSHSEIVSYTLIAQSTENITTLNLLMGELQPFQKRYTSVKNFPFSYSQCTNILIIASQIYDMCGIILGHFYEYVND